MTDSGKTHQDEFEHDSWSALYALGVGYWAYLKPSSEESLLSGEAVWFCLPKDLGREEFSQKEEVIQELIDKTLVVRKEDNLVQDAEARFELTDEGRRLFDELSDLPDFEARGAFVAKVQPQLKFI